MLRSIFFLASAVLISVICKASGQQSIKYKSLYGDKDPRLPITEALPKFGIELLKFIREGGEELSQELKDTTPKFNQEYDFIVVGAGSAGAVVASRLSEVKDATVLLIEAGDRENLLMDVPSLASYLQLGDLNWNYQTERMGTHCLGMVDKRCKWPRGKVMGGSSVLNFMIATRGNRRDYDNWAAMGNEGWSYRDVLKYFKKLEQMQIPELRQDPELHNTDGPMPIGYSPFRTPVLNAFLEGGMQLGYPIIDYNGNADIGFSQLQVTMKNGTRMSSNRAYLHPVHRRKNLFLTRLSHVNKVLIDPVTKRAYGVDFTKRKRSIRVRARKEIILCAGTIGSPQILMLSGVGPSDHLREMDIDVIQDAPVGKNLMDHMNYGGLVFPMDQPVGITLKDLINPLYPYVTDFSRKRSGPVTLPGACEGIAFLDVDNPTALSAWPNMELLFISSTVVSDYSFFRQSGVSDEYMNKYFSSRYGRYSWTIFPILLRPKSRGQILLKSKNPAVHPKIFANYLDDPDDVRILIKGIRAAIEVSNTMAMQQFKSKRDDIPVPGCENYVYDSDEYWECALRVFSFTLFHPAGTCKMAPEGDPTGVVNPRLQVKGIKGLRVADASIMPEIVSGHTNVPTLMIGEKLADMVKEDWGLLSNSFY